MKKPLFISKNVRFTISSHKKATVFSLIVISYNNFYDRERNITSKVQASCYKKYSVHRCSGNIGITACTTAKETKNLHDFSQAV